MTVAEDERSLNRWETALFPPPSPLPPSVIAVSVVIYSKGAVSSAVNALCFNLRLRARCSYTPCPAPSARTLSVPTCGMCIILEKPSRKCVISPRLPLPGGLASCHARAGLPACMPQLGRLGCSLASVPSTGEICATLLPPSFLPSFLPSCAAPGATRPPPSDGETQSALCLPRCRLLA